MKVLVPLPFDISNQAHGRNLRITHLLQAMQTGCEILCVTPDECTAIAARDAMPGVTVQSANFASKPSGEAGILRNEPYLVRRTLSFLGCDAASAETTHRLAPSADAVVGFDIPRSFTSGGGHCSRADTRPESSAI